VQVPHKQLAIPASRIGEPVDLEFLETLKEDIKVNGMIVPILVDENHTIIDGLQRYRAAVDLDFSKVDVVVVTDWTEVLDALHEAHVPDRLRQSLTARRIWQIREGADHYLQAQLRAMYQAPAERKHEFFTSRKWGQNGFARVLRIGGSQAQGAIRMYREAQKETPLGDYARELVKLMDDGELSISGAYKRFIQKTRALQGTPDIQTQRRMMDRIMEHLDSIEQALGIIGSLDPDFTKEEIEVWMKVMYRTNIPLFRLRNELRRKVSP